MLFTHEKEKIDKESMETDCRKELVSHDNVVNTSLVVEASVESGFQFWFQTVYILPTIILSFIRIGGDAKWTDLFNWRMFSILMSFASFAWTFYTIRLIYFLITFSNILNAEIGTRKKH